MLSFFEDVCSGNACTELVLSMNLRLVEQSVICTREFLWPVIQNRTSLVLLGMIHGGVWYWLSSAAEPSLA